MKIKMEYLNEEDFLIREDSGETIKLILMSGIRKIIEAEQIEYTLTLESCDKVNFKGRDSVHIVIKCCVKSKAGKIFETFASASPETTSFGYIVEIAEKRAISRAVLLSMGLYNTFKGADEFQLTLRPKLPTEGF